MSQRSKDNTSALRDTIAHLRNNRPDDCTYAAVALDFRDNEVLVETSIRHSSRHQEFDEPCQKMEMAAKLFRDALTELQEHLDEDRLRDRMLMVLQKLTNEVKDKKAGKGFVTPFRSERQRNAPRLQPCIREKTFDKKKY